MPQRHTPELVMKYIVFFALAVVTIAQIASCRGMYADGANMLAGILFQKNFLLFEHHRLTHAFLTQFPVVFLVQAGVTDLPLFRYLYSAMLLLAPLLFWGLALAAVKDDVLFWPFVMFFSFVYFNTGFFAISESNLCFALTACGLGCMLLPKPLGRFQKVLLMVTAIMYPLEYAATLFLGPILFGLALKHYFAMRDRKAKIYWAVVAGLFLVSVGTGLWEVLTPRDSGNFAAARNPGILYYDMRFWMMAFFAVLTCLTMSGIGKTLSPLLLFPCVLLIIDFLLDLPHWHPDYSYAIRMYMSLAMIPFMLWIIWFRMKGYEKATSAKLEKTVSFQVRYAVPVFSLFIAMSFLDIDLSSQYADFLQRYKDEVNSTTGMVPYESAKLQFDPGEKLFPAAWTHLVTSLVLRDGPDKGIIMNPAWYDGYHGFGTDGKMYDLNAYYAKPSQ